MTASSNTPAEAGSGNDYARFLEDHLHVVDRVVRGIAITGHLSAADADDFRHEALLHLMVDEYHVLRAFEGRSSLATYLNVVLRRLWQDRCARQWGRWRPSAEARRLGLAVVRLECLVQRDGLTLEEAIATVQNITDIDATELRTMWNRVRPRSSRRRVSDDALADVADGRPHVGEVRERREGVAATSTRLRDAVKQLPADDRELLRLRFVDGATMADSARLLGLRQATVYPRVTRLLRRLRTALEAEGLRASDALAHVGVDIGAA